MNKRLAAAALWFYAAWYLWAMIAAFSGLPVWLGPLVGAVASIQVVRAPARPKERSRLELPGSQRVRS